MGQFARHLKRWEVEVPGVLTAVVKKVAFELHNSIVIKTPIDTGRARGNWLIATGSIPRGVVDRTLSAPDTAGALAALADYDAASGISIYIANNLDYIGALEDGHSGQAPSGMVAITVAEFQAHVAKAAASAR